MPSGRFESRAALSALVVAAASTALAAGSAQAQSRSRPLPPLSAPAPTNAPLDLVIPTGKAGAFRGAQSDKEPHDPGAANYGPPRPKIPKRYPPPRAVYPAPFSPKPSLPPLEAYRTAPVARGLSRLRPTVGPAAPPPVTVAVEPTIRVKPKPRLEARPYDPIGIGIGSMRLRPFVETSFGYDDNPNRLAKSSNPKGSKMFRADGGFALQSEWSRHELQANLRMGYSEYFENSSASRPDGAGALTARYDLTRDTTFDLRGRLNLDTQRPGAPAISSGLPNVTVTNRPIIFSTGVQAGPTHRFNRLEVGLRGTLDRVIYENAHYSDGATLDLRRSNLTQYGALGRVAYELSPGIKPFVEGTVDRRVNDAPTDAYGYQRNSTGFSARGGAELRISDLVRGQASGGYSERHYSDPRLVPLRGPTIDAAIIYTPTPLTTVTLRGTTTLNETTLSGASGVMARAITLQVSHDLLRNLTITGTGGYVNNVYQGSNIREEGYNAGVRLDYKITRSIAIRGSYLREQLRSTSNSADYTTNVFLVGLRFQL